MEFLTGNKDSWIYVDELLLYRLGSKEKAISHLQDSIYQTHTWFFDLDGTIGPAPAITLAKRAIGTTYDDLDYWLWCMETAFALATKQENCENKQWLKYKGKFLDNAEAKEEIREFFTEERVAKSLYHGIQKFCQLLDHSKRHFVSRNIPEVLKPFTEFLNFDGFFSNGFDKIATVEEFVANQPHVETYGVIGDSMEDGMLADGLRKLGKDVTTIYCAKNPKDQNRKFHFSTSKDKTCLVDLLL